MSEKPFVSPGTIFVAWEPKATKRPSSLISPPPPTEVELWSFPCVPSSARLTRSVLPDGAGDTGEGQAGGGVGEGVKVGVGVGVGVGVNM